MLPSGDLFSFNQTALEALIPGTLTGLGSMGPRGVRRFCDAHAIGLSQWRTTALTRIIGLDKPQQSAALSELSAVSAKALEMIASTSEQCSGKIPARHYGSSG